MALYNSTNGDAWVNNDGWLASDTPCSWNGVECQTDHVYGVDLYHNGLTGSIPNELGVLANLNYLVLESNQLTGTIPPELGNHTNLQVLSLQSNQLLGVLPQSLTNLQALEWFRFVP